MHAPWDVYMPPGMYMLPPGMYVYLPQHMLYTCMLLPMIHVPMGWSISRIV